MNDWKTCDVRIVSNGEKFAIQFNDFIEEVKSCGFLWLNVKIIKKDNWRFFRNGNNPTEKTFYKKDDPQEIFWYDYTIRQFDSKDDAQKYLDEYLSKTKKQKQLEIWIPI